VTSVEASSASGQVQTPSDVELTKSSHELIDALDHGDLAAVDAALAPSFVGFRGGAPKDRDTMLATIMRRRSSVPYIARRTWGNESVVRKADVLVFMGEAHEVQGGNETHGGYLYDGWYLLQWIRASDVWRVQLLTWQKESTDRDCWNDTFHTGRGFSLEPNRMLVETVNDEEPGAVLELAMGQGRNALYLASQGWKVTGVDISDEALRIAREQAVKRKLALDTVNADIDEWDFGTNRFDLVTMMYAGDHAKWIDKIKASLRAGGLFVVEGWAKESPDSPTGFGEGQLAKLFDGYEILRDEIVEGVPDWAWDKGKLVRFVVRKK
jgi:SAM-dependent methyltransferase